MLAIIAWRNVWRNKLRSWVVILAIALGLWAGVFIMAFSWGMYATQIDKVINTQLSHIQIHHPEFKKNKEVKYFVKNGMQMLSELKEDERIKAITGRTILGGMAASAHAGIGVSIKGISVEEESQVTALNERIVEGKYFEGIKRNPVLIGTKLAEKLKVKLRSTIILTFQQPNGELQAGGFKVVGIYDSGNSSFDEKNVFVNKEDINRLLGYTDEVNEIAFLLNDNNGIDSVLQQAQTKYPNVLVESWKELSPELNLMIESFDQNMYIFMAIILLALAFGIINTMLMAVLERVRELGMLMAIGLNKTKIFLMIMIETTFLSLVGGILGLLLAYVSIRYFGTVGIDMSMFSEGLIAYGFSTNVYPDLEYHYYLEIAAMTIASAMISAIYPARKALKLNPSEAIRKI